LKTTEEILEHCLSLAKTASLSGEVPIGALIVRGAEVLAEATNETEKRGSFLAHAELLAIEIASKKLGTKYLVDCELYVSLEPCPMCRAAAQLSRVKKIHYLLPSEKFGEKGNALWKCSVEAANESTTVQSLIESYRQLLSDFFKLKRG
jgi:tRNA(adenine34) deaminase